MRKFFYLMGILLAFAGCKKNETVSLEDAVEIKADFILHEDAAVLKGTDFIYGVHIDDNAKELAKQVEKVKQEEFDMVPVVIKGIVSKKEEGKEGWEEIVTITEIVSVSNTPSKADVQIE